MKIAYRMLFGYLMLYGCIITPSTSLAKGLEHSWNVEQESENGAILIPAGFSQFDDLRAILLPEQSIDQLSLVDAFENHINHFLRDKQDIHKRLDFPREPFLNAYYLHTSAHYSDPAHGQRIVLFSAYAKPDDIALRIVRMVGPHDEQLMAKFVNDSMEIAKRPAEALAGKIENRQLKATDTPKDRNNPQSNKVPKSGQAPSKMSKAERKRAHHAAVLAKIRTKPGNGLRMRDIEAMTHFLGYNAGVHGADVYTITWLLLRDGTAYKNPQLPPADLNVAVSRDVEPENWTQWKKIDNQYYLASKQEWKKLKGSVVNPGENRTVSFNGRHTRAWGWGTSLGTGNSTREIVLHSDGTFTSSESSMISGPYFSATASASRGSEGETTTSLSAFAPLLLNRSSKTSSGGADNRGQYAIDGFTIEFMSDSGISRRELYYEKYRGSVRIGRVDFIDESQTQ